MRTVLGSGRDPLCLFLLASLGVGELVGCAGRSSSEADADTGGGSAGEPAAGGPSSAGSPNVAGRVGRGGAPGVAGSPSSSAGKGGVIVVPGPEGVLGCSAPSAYLGEETGLVSCDDGRFYHRANAGSCTPSPLTENRYPPRSPEAGGCSSDSECASLPNGRCLNLSQPPFPECISTCETDSDCASDQLCLCDAEVNHCVSAGCRSDADCDEGLLCTNLKPVCGVDLGPFLCQTEDDACTATCGEGRCEFQGDETGGSRVCVPGGVGGCGRPFLIDGQAALARACARRDWLDAEQPSPRLGGLSPELRAALTAWWRDAALMEHASIAAFARFALELLALGAPPSLVEDATRAMADEQRHARTCFAVASAFAGEPVGPGSLDVAGAVRSVDLETVTVTTFLEGCIGETVAAIEARELARHVRDPVLAACLATIADDESRHAALAWRFLAWALERGGPRLARVVDLTLERAQSVLAAAPLAGPDAPDDVALAHGMLNASERHALRAEVLSEIVSPCLRALGREQGSARDDRDDREQPAAPPLADSAGFV